jgi:predicted transcriptional regulator
MVAARGEKTGGIDWIIRKVSEMREFISENYHWIFSGIGATIVMAGVSWFVKYRVLTIIS